MKQSTETYHLEKSIWTEEDFDRMSWHDSPIYAISFLDNHQLGFDIDYIFKWILKGNRYIFWISPCTIIFDNVYDLTFATGPCSPELEIDFIHKSNPQRPKNADFIKKDTEFDWEIETQQGSIYFKSVGFKQFVRQNPRLLPIQKIGLKDRGGISFDVITIS